MGIPAEILREVLETALLEPHGLLVRVSDLVKARGALGAVRRGDPRFAELQFKASPWPDQGDLVIVKVAKPRATKAQLDSLAELGL